MQGLNRTEGREQALETHTKRKTNLQKRMYLKQNFKILKQKQKTNKTKQKLTKICRIMNGEIC